MILPQIFLFPGSEGDSEQTHPLKSSSQEPSESSTPGFETDERRVSPPEGFRTEHIIQIEEPETPESPTKTLYITKEEDLTLQKPLTPTPSIHSHTPTTDQEQILSASSLEAQYKSMTGTPSMTSMKAFPPSPAISMPPTTKAESVTSTTSMKRKTTESSALTTSAAPIKSMMPSDSTATAIKPESTAASSIKTTSAKTSIKPTPSESLTPTPTSSKPAEHLRSPSSRSARVTPAHSPTPSVKTDKGKSKVTGKVVSGWL